jgi:thymidine phosphorylase
VQVLVAKLMGIECRALMTRMSAPIGNYVGNSLEILESVNCLKGEGPRDLQNLVELIGIFNLIYSHNSNFIKLLN